MHSHFKNEVYSWGKSILFAFILVIICRHFIFSPVTVQGESMLPTFKENDKLMLSKFSSVDRFDIVVFKAPDKNEQYVKRIIGMPGDSVKVEDDVLYINGRAYHETYLNKNNITNDFTLQDYTNEQTVPEGYYFVLGDNRWESKDSRELGFISAKSLIGEVKFRYFPLQNVGMPK